MKKIAYILLIVGTLFCSCGDFLEPKSQSEFMPSDVDALSAMLLGEGYPPAGGNVRNLTAPLRLLEDDITTAPPVAGLQGGMYPPYIFDSYKKSFGLFTWQSNYDYLTASTNELQGVNLYENYYKYLSATNLVFDYIDRVSGSQHDKNRLMAEAYTLRAYFYFQLANIYGAPYAKDKKALAVPLKLTGYISIEPLSRNTVEEVYEQILSDLHKAEELFESTHERFTANFRVNIWVTRQLLSRVYLYMEEWDKAAEYAKKVIENTEGIRLIDLKSNPASPSSSYQKFVYCSYANPEVMWIFNNTGDINSFISNFANIVFPGIPNGITLPAFVASESLINSFESNDLRKKEYITTYNAGLIGQFNMTFSKVAINLDGLAPVSSLTNYSQAFRIAEAYLNYAEAEAWKLKTGMGGKAENVQDALNTLRSSRFINYQALSITDADQLINITREERRRELCFEAHRWFDLRRYGMPEIKHVWIDETGVKTYTLTEGDRSYTLAIPYPVVEANKLIIQNPLAPPRNN